MSADGDTQFAIRAARADDLDAVRTLYRQTWGYNRPLAFDRWRYLSPPGGLCPMALAVAADGTLAGAYTLWPVKLRIGGEVVLGAQSMDTMTHPDFQGQGIFTKLAPACFEIAAARGIEVLYGFPNPLSYPGFVRRLNWDHTGDVTHWIRPVRPSRHPRMPRALGPLADGILRLWPTGRRREARIELGRPTDEALDAMLAGWHGGTTGCAVDRERMWLDWRYAEETHNAYEWVCAYDGATLRAVGIWGMRDASWGAVADNRAHLTELMGAPAAAPAVLAAILGRAHAAGAILIETMSNVRSITSVLKRAGFIAHRRAPFIVRALTNRNFAANIHDHAGWRIVGGDVDTF